jgi:2-dehydro-3-deoxygluconokinase
VDTIGAGDAFAAGLLSVILDEKDPLQPEILLNSMSKALKRANIMGALATQYKGDWEGIPNLREIHQITKGEEMITR